MVEGGNSVWVKGHSGRRRGSQNPHGRGSASTGDSCDAGGVRGTRWQCWYGFQEEREGRKERVVGALLIPVCADWAKRGAGSARKAEGWRKKDRNIFSQESCQ